MEIPRFIQRDFEQIMKDKTSIELPSIEDVIDWIRLNLEPESIFNENALENWATNNGFKKENDDV